MQFFSFCWYLISTNETYVSLLAVFKSIRHKVLWSEKTTKQCVPFSFIRSILLRFPVTYSEFRLEVSRKKGKPTSFFRPIMDTKDTGKICNYTQFINRSLKHVSVLFNFIHTNIVFSTNISQKLLGNWTISFLISTNDLSTAGLYSPFICHP